jgi:hypothetical protein
VTGLIHPPTPDAGRYARTSAKVLDWILKVHVRGRESQKCLAGRCAEAEHRMMLPTASWQTLPAKAAANKAFAKLAAPPYPIVNVAMPTAADARRVCVAYSGGTNGPVRAPDQAGPLARGLR